MIRRRIVVGVILSVVSIVLFAPRAHAQAKKNGYSLGIDPAFVEVQLNGPDDVQHVPITFTNYSDEPISLSIFPIDFKQQDDNGLIGFIGQSSGAYSYSLSSFLSFEANAIEIAPREKRIFDVVIKNRQDLSPGGHYAAVVAKLDTSSNGGAALSPSVSSLILLRKVGGERYNLSLSDANWPNASVVFGFPDRIKILFQNEGNVHLVPYGTIDIKDIWGRLVSRGIINTASSRVFPESRRYIPVDMKRMEFSWPISINVMTIDGHDSLNKIHFFRRETFLYINPYTSIIIILIVPIVVFIRRKKT